TALLALLLALLLTTLLAVGLLILLLTGLAVLRELAFQRRAQILRLLAGAFDFVPAPLRRGALRQFLGALQPLAEVAHGLGDHALVAGDVEAVAAVDVQGGIRNRLFELAFDQPVVGPFQFTGSVGSLTAEALHGAQHLLLQ